MSSRYHWVERWRWVHHPSGNYMRRKTDGTVADSYYEAATIEAAERSITRSQFLRTQKYKWLTLAEVTSPVVSDIPTGAVGAEVTPSTASPSASGEAVSFDGASKVEASQPSPGPSYDTAQTIGNAHYERMNLMSAQISIGCTLIVLTVMLAVLPILLYPACATLGGALLATGLSNRRRSQ
jgi:hypothetical protein